MNRQILRNTIFIGLFLVPFVPFLVSSSFFFPFITTKAFAWRLIVEIIFFAWLLLALADESYRPRKSPILYAIGAFLLVIGLADLFGSAPLKSFWSNFERMEGYVTLLHLGAFFLVISSVFKELDWKRWWNTSLVASAFMIAYCLFQIAGVVTINQGGVRVDGTLGNAIYLAVYMLFHIFVAFLYMLRSWKNRGLRHLYMLLIAMQMLVLYFTATRGAILALLGGLLVLAILNVKNKEEQGIRKFSIGVLVAVVALVGSFYLARNSAFVQESPVLSRFATLSFSELKTQGRYFIWPMAWEGFQESPLLGWGQENFSYVFQKYYRPEMHSLEPWFDRAHNIFLDWMVAGGLLGIVAYLSLYAAALYLIWRSGFSTLERSVLVALLSAYFFHNFFVFDNLISYVLFFSFLAYLHSRYSQAGALLWQKSLGANRLNTLALPLVALAAIGTIYFVNWKPMVANTSLIGALQAVQLGNHSQAASNLEKAYDASYLGRTETTEQAAANTPAVIGSNISAEEKNAYYGFAAKAIAEMREKLGDDARFHLMAGSLFTSVGQTNEALAHLEKALELMPNKQSIYFQLGEVYIQKGDYQQALEAARKAYELDPTYGDAQFTYAVVAIYAGDRALETRLIETIYAGDVELENEMRKSGEVVDVERWVTNDMIINAYLGVKRYADAAEVLQKRIEKDPSVAQSYISLASVYLESGDRARAVETLEVLAKLFPQYKDQAEGYIKEIREGR